MNDQEKSCGNCIHYRIETKNSGVCLAQLPSCIELRLEHIDETWRQVECDGGYKDLADVCDVFSEKKG